MKAVSPSGFSMHFTALSGDSVLTTSNVCKSTNKTLTLTIKPPFCLPSASVFCLSLTVNNDLLGESLMENGKEYDSSSVQVRSK